MPKKRLTPRQQEWETEFKKLQRRVREWKRKFHAVPDLPQKPERVTKKDIERLKQFKWKNIEEAVKKRWRKEYEYRYEQEDEEVYQPKPPYTPPTETDFYDNLDYGDDYDHEWEEQHPDWEEPDEDGYTSTVDSESELRQWIADVIESVVVSTSPWGIPNEIYGERAKIIQLIESAFNNAKNKFSEEVKFLRYLEENSDTFNELTLKAIHGYESGGQIHYIEQGGEQAMGQILTLLNFGTPISQWAEEDMRNGDFSNVFWGSGEDFYQ